MDSTTTSLMPYSDNLLITSSPNCLKEASEVSLEFSSSFSSNKESLGGFVGVDSSKSSSCFSSSTLMLFSTFGAGSRTSAGLVFTFFLTC